MDTHSSQHRWLRISLHLDAQALELGEALLWEHGALAISLLDEHDHPLYEPPPGTTPVWPECRVQALFAAGEPPAGLLARLQAAIAGARDWSVEPMADRAWEREWMADFKPRRYGHRLWVCPTHCEPPPQAQLAVRMDPGLAFGSGSHESTALCLEWLDGEPLAGQLVLDYGCGSGILAIAAALLGARRVVALDIDPQALAATRRNASANGVGDRLDVCATLAPETRADVLVANILATALGELAPRLAAAQRPGARLALAGLLVDQLPALRAVYARWYAFDQPRVQGEWALLGATRGAAAVS